MTLPELDLTESHDYLKIADLENFFELFIDKRHNLVFDMNKTIYINVDPTQLPDFICDSVMHWPLISYKIYSTTRLAWLLCKLNRVDTTDIFKAKQPGDVVKYLPTTYANDIIEDINKASDYD